MRIRSVLSFLGLMISIGAVGQPLLSERQVNSPSPNIHDSTAARDNRITSDYSYLNDAFPGQDSEPFMTKGDCRVFLDRDKPPTLFLIKGYRRPNEKRSWFDQAFDLNWLGKSVFVFAFPYRTDKQLVIRGKTYTSRIALEANEHGGKTLDFDAVKEFGDTGGYFTRHIGKVVLDGDGKLVGFSAKKFKASRSFIMVGPMSEFKEVESIYCGTVDAP